ncbi:MAG: tol-pal system protein YbgF [Caulobacterales bacterium]
MVMKRSYAAAMLCAALAAGMPASAQLSDLRAPPESGAPADVRQDRIEELEQQLIEATAENERLQRDLSAAQREVSRLQGMVGDLAVVRDAREASSEPPPVAPAAPRAAPANPTPSVTPPQQGSLGTLPADAPRATAAEAYTRARTLLNNGRLAEAETAFSDFLRDYPNAETAGDARFWHPFTLLARNSYQPAASGFLDYLNRYPNGARAPEALVRLGMALGGLERTSQACAAYRDLPRRYPNASRAVRDLAARESRALSCPAG